MARNGQLRTTHEDEQGDGTCVFPFSTDSEATTAPYKNTHRDRQLCIPGLELRILVVVTENRWW